MPADTSTTHKRKKDKGKQKASLETPVADSGAKNEGIDASWAFQPPPGAKLIQNTDIDNGEFDWDVINSDDDLELWVMRVPESVKPKHLEGLTFDSPLSPSESKSKTMRIGTFKHKHATFDIWSLGDGANKEEHAVGGDELKAFSCLLPKKSKKGRMYSAPRPISRHIILSAQPPQPTIPTPTSPLSSSNPTTTTLDDQQNPVLVRPPRQRYSPELLTHRFMPYGSLIDTKKLSPSRPHHEGSTNEDGEEDVVMAEVNHKLPPTPPPSTQPETTPVGKPKGKKKKKTSEVEGADEESVAKGKVKEKEKKSRKRKGEDSEEVVSSKKSKKTKTVE